jgi:hypothetical protein
VPYPLEHEKTRALKCLPGVDRHAGPHAFSHLLGEAELPRRCGAVAA